MSAGLTGAVLFACGGGESTGPRPVASVQVTAPANALTVGKTLQLSATLQDAAGNTLTGQPVTWETSDPAVATVDALGRVAAASVGAVTITARSGEVSGSLALSTNLDIEPSGTWKRLIAGGASPCALTPAGIAYCWGVNENGRLGRGDDGDTLAHPIPGAVVGGLRFESIAGNLFHACALAKGGAAYCWGWNSGGQLGADPASISQSSVPLAVAGGRTFREVATGSAHSCAITGDGLAFCWGVNSEGQLGTGAVGNSASTPQRVTGGHTFTAVAAYGDAACGLTVERDIYCWGPNYGGELGTGETPDQGAAHPTPTRVVGGHKFLAITRNAYHTCALSTVGEVYCWGDDESGALGVDPATLPTCSYSDVSFPCSTTPVRLPGDMVFSTVAAGNLSTCGIATSGAAFCWGKNTWGQLGDGTTNSSVTPVQVLTP